MNGAALRQHSERIQPIKQHHITDFGAKSKRNASEISCKTNNMSLQTQLYQSNIDKCSLSNSHNTLLDPHDCMILTQSEW